MIAPTVAVLCALALWELVVGIGLLNEDHVPSMTATVAELAELLGDGEFWSAVGSTLQGWALGLGIAAALAIPLGILIGSSPLAYRSVRFVVEFLRPIPSVALVPLAVLIYGVGLESKVFLAAFASFWPLFVQTLYGVQDVDPVATDTARSFGLGRFERLWRIKLPSAVPYIATGLRISSAVALILAVTAEIVIGSPGLGRSINVGAPGRRDRADVRADHHHRPARLAAEHPHHAGRAARAALAPLAPGGGGMTRRLGPVLEVLVPLALLGLWAVWSAGSDTFYYPPLSDILETFSETWVFERVGSDVVPSLLRLGAGYAIAIVAADRGRHPARAQPHRAPRRRADRRVPARDPAARAAAAGDRGDRRRQLDEGGDHRLRVPVAGAAEHDRRDPRRSIPRSTRPLASTASGASTGCGSSCCPRPRRRSSPACAPACRWP